MKILLTGKPRSGKTTLLKAITDQVSQKQGFVTEQTVADGERTGFELVSADGERAILAQIDSLSKIRVGRYGVELESLDIFLRDLPKPRPSELIYVDEIGQMELFSEVFKSTIESYLQMPNHYLGTITSNYEDEFTKAIVQRQDIVLITLDETNREEAREVLEGFLGCTKILSELSGDVSAKVTAMARDYAAKGDFMQLKKLFKNAVRYLTEGRVTSTENGVYRVQGDHGPHSVCIRAGEYSCDCKLFNGEDEYAGYKRECSHIQAVKLFLPPDLV